MPAWGVGERARFRAKILAGPRRFLDSGWPWGRMQVVQSSVGKDCTPPHFPSNPPTKETAPAIPDFLCPLSRSRGI